jgi:hypothetical protein
MRLTVLAKPTWGDVGSKIHINLYMAVNLRAFNLSDSRLTLEQPMPIRNSLRAFLFAVAPLAILHAALFANAIAGNMGSGKPVPMPDNALGIFAARFSIDVMMLAAGHLVLRHYRIATRAAYGLMGGAAVAFAYMIAQQHGFQFVAPMPGTVVTSAIMPVFAGMISGFLYAQFAGRDLAEAPSLVPAPEAASGDVSTVSPTPPSLPPATYDGPVVVRTSMAATAIAAALPAVIVTVITLMFVMPVLGFDNVPSAVQLGLPAQVFFTTLLVMFVPAAIVVGATHLIARSFRLTDGRHYALIGAACGSVAALLLIALVHAALLFPVAVIIGALMGAVYRRFAGIEPLPLPEMVLAEDVRTLVPADHPSRRAHAVIMNG